MNKDLRYYKRTKANTKSNILHK